MRSTILQTWIALSAFSLALAGFSFGLAHAHNAQTADQEIENKASPAKKAPANKPKANKAKNQGAAKTRKSSRNSRERSGSRSLRRPGNAVPTYLIHGELHVGNGQVIKDATIGISGDSILSVGGANDRAILPKNAKQIDLKGQIVTPGLIVAQSPLGLVEIEAEPSTDDSTWDSSDLIHAGFDPASAIFADSSLLAVARVAGITSAAVSPSGGLLSGKITWIDLAVTSSSQVGNYPGIGITGSLQQESSHSRAQNLELLRRVLDDARFYERNQKAFDRGQSRPLSAHPLDLDALKPVLRGRIPLAITAHRASDILALIDLATTQSLKIIVVGASEAWKVADKLAEAKIPVLLQPSANLLKGFDRLGARIDQATLLDQAGVQILIAEIGAAHHARTLCQEAGIAVSYGLDWEKALSAISLNVAQAYGMERQYGTVATGKIANIVVWSGDPLELSSAPARVFVRGQETPLISRQTLLRDRYRDLSQFRR